MRSFVSEQRFRSRFKLKNLFRTSCASVAAARFFPELPVLPGLSRSTACSSHLLGESDDGQLAGDRVLEERSVERLGVLGTERADASEASSSCLSTSVSAGSGSLTSATGGAATQSAFSSSESPVRFLLGFGA